MLIHLINPNTTTTMTDAMRDAACSVKMEGTEIRASTSKSGPASIEGHYDEAMSVLGLIDEIKAAPQADAHVVACFGDPGLLAAREITGAPVIGIAEAAMHAASFISTGFSVVTTLERTRIITEHLVQSYGMGRHCRRVRAVNLPVLDLEKVDTKSRERILLECRVALVEDKVGALVLGCAGMADLSEYLEERLQVPVIDGVKAAVKFAEALVGMGLSTSKHGDLAYPLAKSYSGKLSDYASA